MESTVERAGQTLDSAFTNMLGSSANPTPPYYHQHCPFRRLGKLIAGGSSGPAAVHLITDVASLRLSCCLIGFSFQRLKDSWCEKVLSCSGIEFLRLSRDAFSSTCSPVLHFSDGREGGTDGTPSPDGRAGGTDGTPSRRKPSYARRMTDAVLAINILVYCGQVATWGKLLAWGAQVNHLIDKGQLWRLATTNFLHVNTLHLLASCWSINVIGPEVEAVAGPERFLMVYATSAIASSAMSYRFSKAPSVGACGAAFGLVGYLAVFFWRRRGLTGDADKGLEGIARIILFNMVLGLSVKGIDNWGHAGGFLGGAAASWLLDPAGKPEHRSSDGRKAIEDIKRTDDPGQP